MPLARSELRLSHAPLPATSAAASGKKRPARRVGQIGPPRSLRRLRDALASRFVPRLPGEPICPPEMGQYRVSLVLALAGLEARIALVDDVDAALAAHDPTFLVPPLG